MLRRTKESGFTLIEIIVVLAVVAVLAAMLTPTILRYIEDARFARAQGDAKAIASATMSFNKDLNTWPIWTNGTKVTSTGAAADQSTMTLEVLKTNDGIDPNVGSGTGWSVADAAATVDTLDNQLQLNQPAGDAAKNYTVTRVGGRSWRGPYLANLNADPWGSKYVVNVRWLQPGNIGGTSGNNAVFVLSAGPNRQIDTNFTQTADNTFTCANDDVCERIR